MFKTIQEFFSAKISESTENESFNEHLAAAALLIELIESDGHYSEKEKVELRNILKNEYKISEEDIAGLTSLAQKEVKESTSLFQFTSLINQNYGQAKKIKLVGHLWQLAYADGELDKYEEYIIRKIADLIYVSHSDFIRCKLAVLSTKK